MAERVVQHAADCDTGGTCVECDGCDCGLVERVCTGPLCTSIDDDEQWRDEHGYNNAGWPGV